MTFIQLFEQWIKDGEIYALPTEMKAKDKRAEEVLELINWYCEQYKHDKFKFFVAIRDMNEQTLEKIGASYSNLEPLVTKVISKLKVGNFAGSERDDAIKDLYVYVFIKENFFREDFSVTETRNGKTEVKHGKHLYVKFQFMYKNNPTKGLTYGKKNRSIINTDEIVLKDISLHPTNSLTI